VGEAAAGGWAPSTAASPAGCLEWPGLAAALVVWWWEEELPNWGGAGV
jgi:hypothetical protein